MFKELLRQSSWYFAGYGAGVIMTLITFPLWTRHFTVEEYGILSLIGVTISFVTPLVKFGLHKAVLRLFSEFQSKKRALPESSFYTTFFIGAIALGIFFGAICIGIIVGLGPDRFGSIQTYNLFILAGLTFFISPGCSIYGHFLRVEEKANEFVLVRFVRAVLGLTLSLVLVFVFLLGLKGIYISALLLQVCLFVYVFWSLKRQKKFVLKSFSFALLFEAISFGLPLIGAEMANHISNIGDRFMLQFFLGTEAVGLYAVGYGLTSHLKSLLTVGMFVITPMYVKIWHEQGREKTEQFLSTVLDYYLMAAIPGIVLFSVFGGEILVLMASTKYEQARVLMPYLAAPLALHGAISIYTAGMFIHKKTKLILYFTASAGILNIILNYVLIPLMGITGAAVATLVSYVFLIVLANIFSSRFLTIRLNYHGVIKYIAASVIAVLLLQVITIEIFLGIIIKLLIGLLIYSAAMWSFDARIRQKVKMAFVRI